MNKIYAFFMLVMGLLFLAPEALNARPVLLELFTSEGCSSCPPAEKLLKELNEERSDVLGLSFHVDYWDYIGWEDPYAQKAFTQRQYDYSDAFEKDGRVYTPQAVLSEKELIGSHGWRIKMLIPQLKKEQKELGETLSNIGQKTFLNLPETALKKPADVWLVTYTPTLNSSIAGGENKGRRLHYSNVVRTLAHLGSWNGAMATFPLEHEHAEGDKSAVIIQEEKLGKVLGLRILP